MWHFAHLKGWILLINQFVFTFIMMKYNWMELDCQVVHDAQPWPVDKESHESVVTPASVTALTDSTNLLFSVTHPHIQTTGSFCFSYHTDWQGHWVSTTLGMLSYFHIDIDFFDIFFWFGQFVCGQRVIWQEGGVSRWKAIDRIRLCDRGGILPSVSILCCRLEWRSPHIQPSLSGCHSAPSIWLWAQPPQGRQRLWDTLPLLWKGSTSSDWQPTVLIKKYVPRLPVLSAADILFEMCNL